MNFNELSKPQQGLDEYIKEKRNLQHQDLTKKKTVAAICELYECVNEARFFKFWSDNQKPNTYRFEELDAHQVREWNPMLEEYVDTVHFTVSLGNDHDYTTHKYEDPGDMDLNDLVLGLTNLLSLFPYIEKRKRHTQLRNIFDYLIKFGYQLGFNEQQVMDAYYNKNEINHARQENGY